MTDLIVESEKNIEEMKLKIEDFQRISRELNELERPVRTELYHEQIKLDKLKKRERPTLKEQQLKALHDVLAVYVDDIEDKAHILNFFEAIQDHWIDKLKRTKEVLALTFEDHKDEPVAASLEMQLEQITQRINGE